MMEKYIVRYILFVFFLILKIGTCIFINHAILKVDFQIKEIKLIEIYLTDMQLAVCTL